MRQTWQYVSPAKQQQERLPSRTTQIQLGGVPSMILDVKVPFDDPAPSVCADPNCQSKATKATRFCHYYGDYYCKNCHNNKKEIIPARLVADWDAQKYPVCKMARKYLTAERDQPNINLALANPNLVGRNPKLQAVSEMRTKLWLMKDYLQACPAKEALVASLDEKAYFVTDLHLYSMR